MDGRGDFRFDKMEGKIIQNNRKLRINVTIHINALQLFKS